MNFLKNLFSERTEHPRLSQFTDSGMLCLFNYDDFSHINDYDSWDKELCEDEDIMRNIDKGNFVPISLGDGAFDLEIRIGENCKFNDREKEYLLVQSKPYKLISTGKVCVSPLEIVGGEKSNRSYKFKLEKGSYKVI